MSDPIQKIRLSRFAQRLLAARPELAAELAEPAPFTRHEMLNALAGAGDDGEARLKSSLRHLRNRVLLRVMARDLSGRAGLDEVCGAITDLAEVAVSKALDEDLIVVGMGKLGGRELNVSSDVDLVFLYPGSPDAQERYERAGRRLIQLLSEHTEDGFVFRVDMRLRPYGDSGPLACNFEALEHYFITQGREWERYAWLKARPLSGDGHAELDAIVRPFVFRKYLDYGTLAALRALHAEVRRDVARRELAEHIKLGPGGIREIEFIAQALQLIRGGRDPELRVRPTVKALAVLSQKSLLPESAARELTSAYVFLRNLEHRLQYLDDAQTHELPQDEEDRARVAEMCGFSSWRGVLRHLQEVRDVGLPPFRRRVRPARGAARALAGAPARRRAAREPALRRAAGGVAPPARAPDPGARARLAGDARPRRHACARHRPGGGDREPRRLSRAARRASRGARARRAHDRLLELGGGVHHPPSAAAR